MTEEKTVKQWLKEMAEAGFYGTYRATNGEIVINGEIKKSGETESVRVKTSTQSRQEIKDMFKRGR